MTFWDFCAPFYDFAERRNRIAYIKMLETVRKIVPPNASVLEIAAGTGAISLAIANKVKSVLCTDLSERMLRIARRKAKKRDVKNIRFAHLNIFNIVQPDKAFDVAIAGQVLHLIDNPEKAASELRRVANTAILPISFTKKLTRHR